MTSTSKEQQLSLDYKHSSCALCGQTSSDAKFMFCSKCKIVVYCSREHQVNHWKQHKKFCRDNVWMQDDPKRIAASDACTVSNCACKTWRLNSSSKSSPNLETFKNPTSVSSTTTKELLSDISTTSIKTENKDASSHSKDKKKTPDDNVDSLKIKNLTEKSQGESQTQEKTHDSTSPKSKDDTEHDFKNVKSVLLSPPRKTSEPSTSKTNVCHQTGKSISKEVKPQQQGRSSMGASSISSSNIDITRSESGLSLAVLHKQVIRDMNRFGVCVIDDLLGDTRGGAVLNEVLAMYATGVFEDGQLVQGNHNHNIRGDKIKWLDASTSSVTEDAKNIGFLVKLLDSIVMGANTLPNNGNMGKYKIRSRSRAMVACYPGSGSQYVKHVDNPNDDGRCVTVIYYLNKNWDTKVNGGLLRIFPEDRSEEVADIEPLFDRVVLFWSDRRNPHEVQPAYSTRYAITLWYFDSNVKTDIPLSASPSKVFNAFMIAPKKAQPQPPQ